MNKPQEAQVKNKKPAALGGFTLPAQEGMDDFVIELAKRWRADAIRDSDGTVLSESLTKLGLEVYSTLCLIRADQKWNASHPHDLQQKYLPSMPTAAFSPEIKIPIMDLYFTDQFKPDDFHDPKKYWEVVNRTTSEVVPPADWEYSNGIVTVRNCQLGNVYVVNFLAYQIWESTSMYNHITNNWDKPHQTGVDPRQPETRKHLVEYLKKWISEHPGTDWVRFTSMAYQFPIILNKNRDKIFQDWYGYHDCISALAMDQFEKKFGYRLRPNDLVDNGYFNSSSNVPSKQQLDWISFVHEFLVDFSSECVKIVHESGKKAMLFFCDHWIGTEPYRPTFRNIGFDGVVGPCINGRELRKIADVPGELVKEVRLYPYFFPVNLANEPSFKEGGDPVSECRTYWMAVRRALLRKPVDRIGFGGYLDLAQKFPDFISYVEKLTAEFYTFAENSKLSKVENAPFKVAILNAWGLSRAWGYDQSWPEGGITEALTGLPFDIEWLSFEDLKKNGVPADVGVIINVGAGGSAWSGGKNWMDSKVVSLLRQWVNKGGGFVGVLEPTAHEHGGAYFQLWDVLGVQREVGRSLNNNKYIRKTADKGHFVITETAEGIDLGRTVPDVYPCVETVTVLSNDKRGNVLAAANDYGKGKGVYLAGFKLGAAQNRLLMRAIWHASGMGQTMQKKWYTTNIHTEIAAYPSAGKFVIINNSNEAQSTDFTDKNGAMRKASLGANESKWFDY